MPVSIEIHESGKYLVVTCSGSIRVEDLRSAYEAFYADNSVSIDLPELVDLSGADLSGLTHAGLSSFSSWATQFLESRGAKARKSGRLMAKYAAKSKLILHEVMMQESAEISRTFSNREEAVRWLLDPAPSSAVSQPTN